MFCSNLEETIEHAILICPCVHYVWFGSPLNYRIDVNHISFFDSWFLGWLTCSRLRKTRRMEIWSTLSSFVGRFGKKCALPFFYGRSLCPVDVLRQSASLRSELFHGSVGLSCTSNTTMLLCTWHAPMDGAWHRSSLEGDVGCIICNSENVFVCYSSTFIS